MLEKYAEIFEVAKHDHKVTDGKIDQCFGMVTKVWLTDRCRP
jgi:hypothetical protein